MLLLMIFAVAILVYSVICLNEYFIPIDIGILRGKEKATMRRIHYLPLVDEIGDNYLNSKLGFRDNSAFTESVITLISGFKEQYFKTTILIEFFIF